MKTRAKYKAEREAAKARKRSAIDTSGSEANDDNEGPVMVVLQVEERIPFLPNLYRHHFAFDHFLVARLAHVLQHKFRRAYSLIYFSKGGHRKSLT